jgi:hypothetical protein
MEILSGMRTTRPALLVNRTQRPASSYPTPHADDWPEHI